MDSAAADARCVERHYGLVRDCIGARAHSDDFQFEGYPNCNDADSSTFYGVADVQCDENHTALRTSGFAVSRR